MHRLAARPSVSGQVSARHLAQVVLDAGSEAVGVAVLDQYVGGRVGQKTLEFFRAALDRQVQAVGGEDHARVRGRSKRRLSENIT